MDLREIMKNGEGLLNQGRLADAEEQFLLVSQHDHENKEALNNLGFIAFSRKNAEKAMSFFRKALDIDPSYIDAVINICNILYVRDAFPEALMILNRAIAMNHDNGELQKMVEDINAAMVMKKRNEDTEGTGRGPMGADHGGKGSPDRKPIKVIHLPLIIANNAIALSKYLNRLGVDSKVISYFRTWLNYEGDINLDLDSLNIADRNKKVREFVDDFFAQEADKYDIFHFHFFDTLATGTSFGGWKSHPEREDYWDLQKLKEMGKKIVVSSWGSDVRNNSKIVYYQLKYEDPSIQIPYPPLNRRDQYFKIWQFSQYADAIVHGDRETLRHTPYGEMIPIGIDVEPFDVLMKGRNGTGGNKSILYAPSNQFYKGTKYTEAVLKRVQDRPGERVEIRKIHGLSHQEAMKAYLGDGAAIDDIAMFSFGLFALEAMYLGRTVFTTLCKEEYSGEDPKLEAPIVSVNNENDFYQKLAEFIESDVASRNGGYQGFVREKFSASVIAGRYRDLYERLMAGEKVDQFVSQEWNREFNLLLSQKKIDQRDYYPQVTDILLRNGSFDKLFHEVKTGMGLNNDIDLFAKYILALELTNQQERAAAERRTNGNVTSREAFLPLYRRAQDLYHSKNP